MTNESGPPDIDEKTLLQFLQLTHRYTGITLAPNKKLMLQGRLRLRMRKLGITNYPAYLQYLESHSEEKQVFIDLVTTNETYFYRTPRIWEYLETEYLPQWLKQNPGSPFNAWSAAASSGEEAYTLGSLLQLFKEKNPGFSYQIFGTDISQEILSVAQKGSYAGRSIELFKEKRPEPFQKYMRKNDSGAYSPAPEVRTNVCFQQHNLFEKPKFKLSFDLVLIRNVLIYFEASDQEKVLRNISQAMKKDSVLIIGESESLNRLQTPFAYKMPLIYHLGNAA